MTGKGYALSREQLIRALTAYTGITTLAGAVGGTTLIDANLIGKDSQKIVEKTILIMSGDADWEDKGASAFDTGTGKITLQSGVSAQIKAGTIFRILNISSVEIEVADIEAKLDGASGLAAIKAVVDAILVDTGTTLEAKLDVIDPIVDAIKVSTDKQAGATPVVGTANEAWNTAEANVVSIGANDTKNKLHSLLLSIHNLVGTTITVRMYMQVKGAERKVYDQAFDATSDPPGLWIVNGTTGIHEVLRVTLQSNAAADDDKDVDYDYMLEAM
ncbi:hypothetical protein ES703_99918 [subsurface metagenome]